MTLSISRSRIRMKFYLVYSLIYQSIDSKESLSVNKIGLRLWFGRDKGGGESEGGGAS